MSSRYTVLLSFLALLFLVVGLSYMWSREDLAGNVELIARSNRVSGGDTHTTTSPQLSGGRHLTPGEIPEASIDVETGDEAVPDQFLGPLKEQSLGISSLQLLVEVTEKIHRDPSWRDFILGEVSNPDVDSKIRSVLAVVLGGIEDEVVREVLRAGLSEDDDLFAVCCLYGLVLEEDVRLLVARSEDETLAHVSGDLHDFWGGFFLTSPGIVLAPSLMEEVVADTEGWVGQSDYNSKRNQYSRAFGMHLGRIEDAEIRQLALRRLDAFGEDSFSAGFCDLVADLLDVASSRTYPRDLSRALLGIACDKEQIEGKRLWAVDRLLGNMPSSMSDGTMNAVMSLEEGEIASLLLVEGFRGVYSNRPVDAVARFLAEGSHRLMPTKGVVVLVDALSLQGVDEWSLMEVVYRQAGAGGRLVVLQRIQSFLDGDSSLPVASRAIKAIAMRGITDDDPRVRLRGWIVLEGAFPVEFDRLAREYLPGESADEVQLYLRDRVSGRMVENE